MPNHFRRLADFRRPAFFCFWWLVGVVHVADLRSGEANLPALQWRRTDTSLALLKSAEVVWQYNYGDDLAKPYFHPITVGDQVLTWDRPPDHVWHHGVWFSWKFINRVNYWEPNEKTGKPDGTTEWQKPVIETQEDHSAVISMSLSYAAARDGQPVLAEQRIITVAPPKNDGELAIDWKSEFSALTDVTLDRTPAGAKPWGGYAGLSVRFAKELTERAGVSLDGGLEFDEGNRHRSRSAAVDYSGLIKGVPVGLAFFDLPSNPRHPTKWYLIRTPVMSYMNAALLHDEPLQLKDGEKLALRYRLIAHSGRWDAGHLRRKYDQCAESLRTKSKQ